MPNIAYPYQHIDTEIPYGSRDHMIVSDTVKITFNLENESMGKACSIVKNVGRVLVKKKVPIIGSKDADTINNPDVYGTNKDLYLSKKNVKRSCFKVCNQPVV